MFLIDSSPIASGSTQMNIVEQNPKIINDLQPQTMEPVLLTTINIDKNEFLTLPNDDEVDINENEVYQVAQDPANQNKVEQILNTEVESVDLFTALTEVVKQVVDKRCKKMEDYMVNQFTQSNLQMSQINTKLDKLIKDVSKIMNVPNNDNNLDILEPNINSDTINFTDQFPISDSNKVLEFELKLQQDDNFRKLLLTELCKFGGTNKNEQADKVVYAIFDFLFEPELLVHFSWTGASKSQDITKQSFQKLHNIIELLYDVLSRADSRHTKSKNESLIRDKVLKHTNQRLIRKRKPKKHNGIKEKDNNRDNNLPITGKKHEDNIVNDVSKEADVEPENPSSIEAIVVLENLIET